MISSAEPGSAILSPSENGAAVCMNRKLQNNFLPGELSGSQKDPDFYRTEPGGARVSMVLAEAGRAPLRPQLRSIKRNEGIRTIRHQSGDLLADLERATDRTRSFAHVGKVVDGQNAETADSSRAQRPRTDGRGRSAGTRPPGRKPGRMGGHSGAGARAGRLALSGLPRAAPLGRAPRGQALPRRLRLRPGSVGRALPMVP